MLFSERQINRSLRPLINWKIGDRVTYYSETYNQQVVGTVIALNCGINNGCHRVMIDKYNIWLHVIKGALDPYRHSIEDGDINYA